jgi:hypothetical protein
MEFLKSETLGLCVAIAIVLKGFILLMAYFFRERSEFLDIIAIFIDAMAEFWRIWVFGKDTETKTLLLAYVALCFFLGGGACIKYLVMAIRVAE